MTWDILSSKPINWFCCLRNCCYCLFPYLDQCRYRPSQISIALPLLLVRLSSLLLFSCLLRAPVLWAVFLLTPWPAGLVSPGHHHLTSVSLPTPAEGCHVLPAPWGDPFLSLTFTPSSSHTSIKFEQEDQCKHNKDKLCVGARAALMGKVWLYLHAWAESGLISL